MSQESQQIIGVPLSRPLHVGHMHISGPSLMGGAMEKVEEMVTVVAGGGAFAREPDDGCKKRYNTNW